MLYFLTDNIFILFFVSVSQRSSLRLLLTSYTHTHRDTDKEGLPIANVTIYRFYLFIYLERCSYEE